MLTFEERTRRIKRRGRPYSATIKVTMSTMIATILVGATMLHFGYSFIVNPQRRRHPFPSTSNKEPRGYYNKNPGEDKNGSHPNKLKERTDGAAIAYRRFDYNHRNEEMAKAILQNPLQSYLKATEESPYLTKSITAAVVTSLGDILAQYLEATNGNAMMSNLSSFSLDWMRLEVFFLCGLLYVGPYVHWWYERLESIGKWMAEKFNSSTQMQTLVKVMVDQTIGVICSTPLYFYVYEIIRALVYGQGK